MDGPLNTISYDIQSIAAARIFVRFAKWCDIFVQILERIVSEMHLSSLKECKLIQLRSFLLLS